MPDAYEKLIEVLVTHLGLSPELIHPEMTFDELGVDSLARIELAVVLEKDYGINVEGIDGTSTLAQAAAAHVEKAAATSRPDLADDATVHNS